MMATMPGSRKLARRSVSLIMQLGLSKADAAQLVQIICDEVARILWRRSPDIDMTWLADIAAEARVIQDQSPRAASAGAAPSPVRPATAAQARHDARLMSQAADGALQRPGA